MLCQLEGKSLVIKYNELEKKYEFFAKPTKMLRDSLLRFEDICKADSDYMAEESITEDPFFRLFRKMNKTTMNTIREGRQTPLDADNIVFHRGQFYYEGKFSTAIEG